MDKNNFFKDGKFVKQSVRAKKFDEYFTNLGNIYSTTNRSELLWLTENTRPMCRNCGQPTNFLNYEKGYRQLCSDVCARKDSLTKQKRVNAIKGFFNTHHKVNNPMQLKSTKDKVNDTNIDRYGVKWYVETDDFKESSTVTSIKNWGTDNPQQSEKLKAIIKENILRKYGRTTARTFTENRQNRFNLVMHWCSEMQISFPEFDIKHPIETQEYEFSHTCGHVWSQTLSTLPVCEVCHRGSKVEQNLKEWVKTLGLSVKFNDRQSIRPLELDILFPDNNIAIEMNGLYWHHDDSGRTSVKDKTDLCVNKNIQLISIWENEWLDLDMRRKLQGLIKAKLGIAEKIHARKTTIKKLDLNECRNFMNINHLQGWASNSESYGLIYEGEIVMAISVGVRRWNSDADLEIIRLCSKCGISVIGGFSKLLKLFHNKRLMSYCDRRFGNGRGYEAVGFELEGVSKPNYVWWKGNTFLKRGATTKQRLPSLLGENYMVGESEDTNMKCSGWKKLSDAGNLRYFKYPK